MDTHEIKDGEIMTPAEAARAVGGDMPLTPDALRRYDDELQPLRVGPRRARLYRRDVVERFAVAYQTRRAARQR